ncbi:putative BsuMI modification methylase subunit YdiO [bacterium BMS3Abin15]|nr:putative BsuMI modification methylase subunit YdiO [bacterium BMS3Abin15]
MNKNYTLNAIDIFSGCGGLTEGMRRAGFDVRVAIEIDADSVLTYKMNHPDTKIIQKDIREVKASEIKKILGDDQLHLLAGCPPCQGFSSVRRLNRKRSIRDERNSLVAEYLRFVKELRPLTVMMENVPGLKDYFLFRKVFKELQKLGYNPKVDIVNIKDYGVPQRRRRLVMVGSLLGKTDIAAGTGEKVTVRQAIGGLEPIETTTDPVHKITTEHTQRIKQMIAMIPKNGGSRKDLPEKFTLNCHKRKNVGFNDIYGRLRWDDYSTTITGGCLNPSKGRFLHPEENRAITPREAALLQSFRKDYKFPVDIKKSSLALLIGNALPPKFSFIQCRNIKKHLDKYLA